MVAALAALSFATQSAQAAELRLRAQCQSQGGLVTLGDVAEIFAADRQQADALAAVELFPAPSTARQRFVRLREIQDLLLLRGINLTEHRFSGSSQVAVLGAEPLRVEQERPLTFAVERRANRRVSEAVVQYLQQQATVSADAPWVVEVQLSESQARLAADPARRISVAGGRYPWTGLQRFEVALDTPEGTVRFPVDAQVTMQPGVLVAVRSLPRGALITAADVALQHKLPQDESARGFYSPDDVIGKETVQAIAEGKMLQPKMVRAPLLVRRRDVVTVYACNSGIRVRTLARARDDGSLGDLIAVETLEDRKAYFARVSGVREVGVYARSVQAGGTSTGGASPLAGR